MHGVRSDLSERGWTPATILISGSPLYEAQSGPECSQPEERRILDPTRNPLKSRVSGIGAIGHAPDHPFLALGDGRHLMAHLGAFEDDHGIGPGRDHALASVQPDHQPGLRKTVGFAPTIDDWHEDSKVPTLVEIVVVVPADMITRSLV